MKKIDKETIIVVLIAGLLLLGWFFFYPKYQSEKVAEQKQNAAEIARTELQQKLKDQTPPPLVTVNESKEKQDTGTPEKHPAPEAVASTEWKDSFSVLVNELAEFKINTVSGDIASVTLKKFETADKTESSSPKIVMGLKSPEKTFRIDFSASGYLPVSVESEKTSEKTLTVIRKYKNSQNGEFELIQNFELLPDSYILKSNYSFSNLTKQPLEISSFKIWASGVPPLKYLAGDTLYNDPHNVDYCLAASQKVISVDPAAKDEKFFRGNTAEAVDWTGSTDKYFASLLFPKTMFNGGIELTRAYYPVPGKPDDRYSVPAIAGLYRNFELPVSGAKVLEFEYFCGPKEISLIRQLPETAMDVMHLSYFSWMDFLARPLLKLLNYLKSIFGSYGWAIIMLTVIVRVVFWPVTQKANNSMRKMQKLQPMVAEIRTKYKENPQEMNMKMMELYRTQKVNPLGGCLPILLQLPVFFALYSALDSSVELRQVAFLWATDLTKPDLIGPTVPLPFLGNVGLHPLVLIMTGLMVLQQKMTPAMGDPMQQKMMMMMPVIMLFMLYNLPSGLTLYWTVSQIFSIIQLKYSQYVAKREEEKENSALNNNRKKTA